MPSKAPSLSHTSRSRSSNRRRDNGRNRRFERPAATYTHPVEARPFVIEVVQVVGGFRYHVASCNILQMERSMSSPHDLTAALADDSDDMHTPGVRGVVVRDFDRRQLTLSHCCGCLKDRLAVAS